MAQGHFAMEGKCPIANLTDPQGKRHFESGWGHSDLICHSICVSVPFCHATGAVLLPDPTQVGGILPQDRGNLTRFGSPDV